MNITPFISQGLGVLPISLAIELDKKLVLDLDIKTLLKYDCLDIIFYGDIRGNLEELHWIVPRLISEGRVTSMVADIYLKRLPMVAKLFIPIDFKELHKRLPLIAERVGDKSLTKDDIFILYGKSIEETVKMRETILTQTPCAVATPIQFTNDDGISYHNYEVYDIFIFRDYKNIFGGENEREEHRSNRETE